MSVLISLVGEQPVPNLIAIRAEQPDAVVLVWSALTKGVACRLSDLPKMPEIIDCPVNAYDFDSIRDGIDAAIAKRGWVRDEITFNKVFVKAQDRGYAQLSRHQSDQRILSRASTKATKTFVSTKTRIVIIERLGIC